MTWARSARAISTFGVGRSSAQSSADGYFVRGRYSQGASRETFGSLSTTARLTRLLSSATGFLSFMSGYTVFLGPISGIMITDVSFRLPFVRILSKDFEVY